MTADGNKGYLDSVERDREKRLAELEARVAAIEPKDDWDYDDLLRYIARRKW